MEFIDCITLVEANKLIQVNLKCVVGNVTVPIIEAQNRVAAIDIIAGEDIPPFARSTVDGYAVKSSDSFGAEEGSPALLSIGGEVLMGQVAGIAMASGEICVIPTGGMLPLEADAVIMLEHTESFNEHNVLLTKKVAPGENVIQQGEDVRIGQIILPAGRKIRSQDIGILAALGQSNVVVKEKLIVGIISTGDEIVDIEVTPRLGQVRDINSYVLAALLTEQNCQVKRFGIIPDTYDALYQTASAAIAECQLVIISGGSSMGVRDFTVKIINSLGQPGVLFHGIAAKPGKPTIFGRVGSVPIFGLPGHPTAAIAMFNRVVKPAVQQLNGQTQTCQYLISARMRRNLASAPGRDDCVSVRLCREGDGYWAEPIFGRSGLISIMTEADGVIYIPAEVNGLYAGDMVEVELFR